MATAGLTATPAEPVLQRLQRSAGLTAAGFAVLGAAAGGWVVARLAGGRTLFLLAYGAVLLVLLARFMGRKRLALNAARTELPPRLRQGQSVDIEVQLTATRRVGVFVMEEDLHPHLGRQRRLPVAGLPGGGGIT